MAYELLSEEEKKERDDARTKREYREFAESIGVQRKPSAASAVKVRMKAFAGGISASVPKVQAGLRRSGSIARRMGTGLAGGYKKAGGWADTALPHFEAAENMILGTGSKQRRGKKNKRARNTDRDILGFDLDGIV